MIAGVLVSKNSHHPAGPKQLNGTVKTVGPIKGFHPSPSACSPNVFVNVTVSKLLINGPQPDVIHVVRKHLRK